MKIGFVDGKGTTTEPQNYYFNHKELKTGAYLYRLKQIDFNGTFQYSKEVKVEIISPNEFVLEQNYPNPFNPSTKISWQSPVSGHQTLKIFDVLGNEVATLFDEYREAGRYEVEFNVAQVSRPEISSGLYLYKMTIGNFSAIRKMMLIK